MCVQSLRIYSHSINVNVHPANVKPGCAILS